MNWRTSSYTHNGGNCVEIADAFDQHVHLIRDSKNRTQGHLEFQSAEWQAFLHAVQGNELD